MVSFGSSLHHKIKKGKDKKKSNTLDDKWPDPELTSDFSFISVLKF